MPARKHLRQFLGRLEGLLLVLLAAYIGWLVNSDQFWQMLNPRFRWLEAAAATGLLLTGGVLLFRPVPSNALRLGTQLVFGLLLATTLWGPAGMALPQEETASDPFAVQEPASQEPLEIGGHKYVPISTVELLNLLEKRPKDALAGRWALRGVVARSPALDERESFVLVRPFVWCCLADAVAVGFVTPWENYGQLQAGEWVRVAGRVQRLPALKTEDLEVSLGPFYVALDDAYALFPDTESGGETVKQIAEPSLPYVFSVRETAPFSW